MEDRDLERFPFDVDGFQNVQPPEGWIPPEEEPYVEDTSTVRVFNFIDSPTEVPYRSDIINIAFTPEQLQVMKEVLQKVCLWNPSLEYVEEELKINLFDQQTYIRDQLIDKVDMYLDEYVEKRPYTPLLKGWVKRIGKEDVRKLQTNRT